MLQCSAIILNPVYYMYNYIRTNNLIFNQLQVEIKVVTNNKSPERLNFPLSLFFSMLSNNYRSICSLHDDEAPAEYEYSSMILLTFDVDSYLISRNFGDCALEMPTPGVGPCYSPGTPPCGREMNIQNRRGLGIFYI